MNRNEVAQKACKAYKESIDNYIEAALKKIADTVVNDAIVFRQAFGHQYTGNLINSICAGVFKKKSLVYSSYAYKQLNKPPIKREMSKSEYTISPTGKIIGRVRVYHFAHDWQGDESTYEPPQKTDEWYGQLHAKKFIENYMSSEPYFEIVIAYTTDYAQFAAGKESIETFNRFVYMFESFIRQQGRAWSKGAGFPVKLVPVNVTR